MATATDRVRPYLSRVSAALSKGRERVFYAAGRTVGDSATEIAAAVEASMLSGANLGSLR